MTAYGSWSEYSNAEGWKEYELWRLIELPIPNGPERNSFLRRLSECKNKEEAKALVDEISKLYADTTGG
jgi:hypothetical protein